MNSCFWILLRRFLGLSKLPFKSKMKKLVFVFKYNSSLITKGVFQLNEQNVSDLKISLGFNLQFQGERKATTAELSRPSLFLECDLLDYAIFCFASMIFKGEQRSELPF